MEILRDFLSAVREAPKKTRIIGLANLNPSSFQLYLEFCLAHQLVEDTPEGYRLTHHADGVLKAIQQLIERSEEVDAVLLQLQRGFDSSSASLAPTKQALRYVSVLAWNEVVRSVPASLGVKPRPLDNRLSVEMPVTATPEWAQGTVEGELDGSVLANPSLSGAALLPLRQTFSRATGSSRSENEILADPRAYRGVPSRWIRASGATKTDRASEGGDSRAAIPPPKRPRRRL